VTCSEHFLRYTKCHPVAPRADKALKAENEHMLHKESESSRRGLRRGQGGPWNTEQYKRCVCWDGALLVGEEEAKAGKGHHWQEAISKQAATPVELDPVSCTSLPEMRLITAHRSTEEDADQPRMTPKCTLPAWKRTKGQGERRPMDDALRQLSTHARIQTRTVPPGAMAQLPIPF